MPVINNSHIDAYISELSEFFGFRPSVNAAPILDLVAHKRLEAAAQAIADKLGLPIHVVLSDAPSEYDPRRPSAFSSSHLVNVDAKGHAQGAVTAEVSMPLAMPMLGTAELSGYPIHVRVGDDCWKHPHTFIAVMAHELSHVVLAACYHREKHNEVFTDLTAMILGFDKITRIGRNTVSTSGNERTTTTYGYMSESQFQFAMETINRRREAAVAQRQKAIARLTASRAMVARAERNLDKAERLLAVLDQRPPKRMSKAAMEEIVAAHQPGFFDELRRRLAVGTARVSELESRLTGPRTIAPVASALEAAMRQDSEECIKLQAAISRLLRAVVRHSSVKIRVLALVRP